MNETRPLEKWNKILDEWNKSGEITEQMAYSGRDFLESLFDYVDSLIKEQKPWEAYTELQLYLFFMSTAAQQYKKPGIINILFSNINKFRQNLEAIAKQVGANGFSISAGFPWGISISISFPVK